MSSLRTAVALLLLPLVAPALCAQPADPLPEGARLRLGSAGMTLDLGVAAAALSPDGKDIAAASNGGLGLYLRDSGKRLDVTIGGRSGAEFGRRLVTGGPTRPNPRAAR